MIQVGPYKVRQSEDGTVFIPRNNSAVEKYLDTHHVRVFGNELRWHLKIGDYEPIDELQPLFQGLKTYIIGKGPSLDTLRREHFTSGCPIICLNDSIRTIEALDLENPLIAIQQDGWLKVNCLPKRGVLIISPQLQITYGEQPGVYIFSPLNFAVTYKVPTIVWAIQLAKVFGTTELCILACDAYSVGDTSYAKSIGYPVTDYGSPDRFFGQKIRVMKHLKDIAYTFVSPQDLDSLVPATP